MATEKKAPVKLNIYEKMAAITAELKTVSKNLDVKAGASSYKAVSERDIIDAVKPLEEKYGIYSYPADREILESSMLENEKVWKETVTKTTTFFTRMKTTYMFINTENPEERITMVTFSEGIDTQDKGSGKAMTYADKYALMKAYKISTGDDPDQHGSEDTTYTRPVNQTNRVERKASNIRCANCGNNIKAITGKDGTTMEPNEIANYSVRRFGAPFCASCQRDINNKHGGTNEPENQRRPL